MRRAGGKVGRGLLYAAVHSCSAMSLRGHLCLPAPGTATAAIRMEGASAERLLNAAPARMQLRARHAALAASPSSAASSVGLRQRFGWPGSHAVPWRSLLLRRCTEWPAQLVRASPAQPAPLRSTRSVTRPAATAKACVAVTDIFAAPLTVYYWRSKPASQLTGDKGCSRNPRDASSYSVTYRHSRQKPALAAALSVAASQVGGGYALLAACSVSHRQVPNMSANTLGQRAVAAAGSHRQRARAAHGEPAERDPDSSGNISDGAEGDPEVSSRLAMASLT